MGVVNGESVWWTSSSSSFDTRPLRAFIMKSILSFITCISATICGGAVSVTDGWLVFYRSFLLKALLSSGPSLSAFRQCSVWAQCSFGAAILLGRDST